MNVPRLTQVFRRFLGATRGVAVVEFALTLPILIGLLVGLSELSENMMIYRRMEQTSQSVAWAAARLYTPASATTPVRFSANAQVLMREIVLAVQRESADKVGFQVAVRREVMTTTGLQVTPIELEVNNGVYKSHTYFDVASQGDPGTETLKIAGLKNGDSIFVVDISYYDPFAYSMFKTKYSFKARAIL